MRSRNSTNRHAQRWAIAIGLAAGTTAALAVALGQAPAKTPQPVGPAQARPVSPTPVQVAADKLKPTAATPPTPNAPDEAAQPAKPPQDPEHAHIVFSTIPMTNAKVVWGRKTLGMIRYGRPLTVVRPRDSGPLDVMIYAPGYLPVQTRAHTFEDQQIVVRLTKPEDKSTLWGYRAPLDAGIPDGGVLPEGLDVPDGQVPQPPGTAQPQPPTTPAQPQSPTTPAQPQSPTTPAQPQPPTTPW